MRGLPNLGLLLLTLTACSANVSSSGESDADALTQTTAVVTFERTTTGEAGREVVRGAATARFVQARSAQTTQASQASQLDDRALKLVGAAFEAPPSFGCVPLSEELDAAAGRSLELADVGGLQVTQTSAGATPGGAAPAGRAFPLVPRQVPDPVGLVGGVLYYAATPAPELSSLLVPGSRYSVRAAGSPGVAAFELSGSAPLEVSEVRVSGAPNNQSAQGTGRVAIAGSAQTVEVAWSTADGSAARETGDVFFVDVVLQRTSGTLRCAADASGATIPSSAFSVSGASDSDGTIAVHRVHRERARSNGGAARSALESSELRFDFSRVIAFSRR